MSKFLSWDSTLQLHFSIHSKEVEVPKSLAINLHNIYRGLVAYPGHCFLTKNVFSLKNIFF